MSQIAVAHSRAPQILCLLNEYGPLSVKGLETIIRPRIAKRRLQEALVRLYEKGLVIRRFEASPFSRQYYELSQAEASQKEVHRLTGITEDKLLQPYFRSQELLHNEECAFWAHYLKEIFPESYVVRDFRLKEYPDICEKLLLSDDPNDLLPDIVLCFPESFDSHAVAITFEIELTRKTNARLYRKFKKYSNASRVDGVVYLCHKNTLAETLRSVYVVSNEEKRKFLNHYQHLFLLFGDRSFNAETREPNLFNIHQEPVSFRSWVHTLRSTPYNRRLNLKLARPA